jgi:hypothetical protein
MAAGRAPKRPGSFGQAALEKTAMRTLAAMLALPLLLLAPVSSSAQQVHLEFTNGAVTLRAENAPIRLILSEWSKRGGTRIINGDRVGGGPVTLELNGVPELQAIEVLLRGVAGYMVGRREVAVVGPGLSNPSVFDRIHIVPTSTPPRPAAVAAPAPPRGPLPPRPPISIPEDVDTPEEDLVVEPNAVQNGRVTGGGVRGAARAPGAGQPVEDSDDDEETPPPAQPTRGNPFGGVTGTARPGMIVQPEPPRPTPRPQPNTER